MTYKTLTIEQIGLLCDRIQFCWQTEQHSTANILMEEALHQGLWTEMMTELRRRYPEGVPA